MSTPSATELRPRVPGVSPTTTRLLSRAVPSSLPSSVGLVVDDEPQVAVVLNDVLTTLGYVVQVTETGPATDRTHNYPIPPQAAPLHTLVNATARPHARARLHNIPSAHAPRALNCSFTFER
jgi:hypothetical protein